MSEDTASLVAAWAPFVVFIVIVLFLSLKNQSFHRKYDVNVAEFNKHYAEMIALNREMAATLVEIRRLLETGRP